jgi:hypothetical protein
MSDFDRSSTDAMVWATEFCKTAKENNWTMESIDEGLMVGWFANYWAAVHDPLHARISELEDAWNDKEKERIEARTRQTEMFEQLTAVQKDAERYRWLRMEGWLDDAIMDAEGIIESLPETLDAAIDAAKDQG